VMHDILDAAGTIIGIVITLILMFAEWEAK
jgi:hypothetical protein